MGWREVAQVTDLIVAQISASSPAAVLAGGATLVAYNGPAVGSSYGISFDALTSNAPAAPSITPFYKVSVLWKDVNGGNIVVPPQVYSPVITNVSPGINNALCAGRGPVDASWLTVLIKNLDTAPITIDFELLMSQRTVTRHDVRSQTNNILGTYTFGIGPFSTPVSNCANNMLGYVAFGPNLNHGTVLQRLNGLYAGEVQLAIQLSSAVNPAVLSVLCINPEFASPVQTVYPATSFTIADFVTDLTLPRAPCIVSIANQDPTLDTGCTYTLTPKEFAS